MNHFTATRNAVCIAALFAGGAAHADVTAAQVWEDWKDQLALYGDESVSIGSEESSGGTVTVRDLSLSMDDDVTTVEVDFGDIVFSEQGNGTVSITLPESYPVTITDEDGVVITILVSQTDLVLTVSGDEDALQYDFSADKYQIELQDVVNGDITFTGDIGATANNVSGQYTTSSDTMRNVAYAISMDTLDILVDVQVPGDDGGYITASGIIAGIAGQAEITLPLDADIDNPDELMTNGFSFAGGYSLDSGTYIFDIDAEGDRVAGSVSTGSVQLDGTLNSETVAYQTLTNDIAVNITVPNFPFPIDMGLGQYGLGFEIPVAKADDPSDFGMNIDLVDLTVSDMIWNMFDSGNVLPRDPATVQIDVTGTITPRFDLMDPAQAEMIEGADMPVEINSLDLNNLNVAVAGALVTGVGGFTFDNSDLTTFDGIPRPEGDAVIEVTGLNKLMDNLVAMGLIPEDQIMGGRMMLGMFARNVGDDRLETRIEINGEGHLIVNGQRLR